MRLPASSGSTASMSYSSPGWTNMARRCSGPQPENALPRNNSPTAPRRNSPRWAPHFLPKPATSCAPRNPATMRPSELWARMAAAGDIYLAKYPGWYSVRDEAFFDGADLTEGPDGTRLAPTGAPVEWVEEE